MAWTMLVIDLSFLLQFEALVILIPLIEAADKAKHMI
jgi:hypothetical protein